MTTIEARTPIHIEHPDRLYIGGEWVKPKAGGQIELVSPATEQVFAKVAEAREADMDAAVAAARKAFDEGPWPRLTHAERAEYLRRMADILEPRIPELASAWTEQIGGLAVMGPGMHLGGVMQYRFYADLAGSYEFERRQPSMVGGTAVIVREPVGVVAAIAPWNAPFMIMTTKVAPALLAGCTVIMKPAPETPLETYILAEAAEAAGIPPGVVNLAPSHREAADHLVRNPGVDKVGFTGSTVAGRRIATVCGERIARYTLELGGKSAALIMDDYDIAQAAKVLSGTITVLTGQVCATLSRAIVPKKRHDQLAEAIIEEMKQVRIGDPYDPATMMGPVAMKRQLERVEGYIAKGVAEGAKLVTGGQRPTHMNRGYYIEPTLFTNVDNTSTIAQEEIFGPVLSLIPAEDEADMIRLANQSIYGLNGAVLTHDADKAYDVARKVRTGAIGQGGLKLDFALPFDGFKQSGVGREGGAEGILPYLETKTILLD
jgi:acyl-CoA reductase-like NAD-dependent aldehyde dehydrogenase